MKRFILAVIFVALMSFMIVGCTKQNSSDKDSGLPKVTNPQEVLDEEFIEYQGKVATITEETVLKRPYVITTDENNNQIYQELENEDFSLYKNDMVIVIEENDMECRIVQAFGDIPRIRGTVEKDKLSYDKSIFIDNANQAIVNDAMSYDAVDGNEKGVQYGVGIILERRGEWVRMSIPMQESDLWFKMENLSYDFDTSVIDIKY
jgi:hypothetical protein